MRHAACPLVRKACCIAPRWAFCGANHRKLRPLSAYPGGSEESLRSGRRREALILSGRQATSWCRLPRHQALTPAVRPPPECPARRNPCWVTLFPLQRLVCLAFPPSSEEPDKVHSFREGRGLSSSAVQVSGPAEPEQSAKASVKPSRRQASDGRAPTP